MHIRGTPRQEDTVPGPESCAAAGTDNGIAGYALARGHEVRLRGGQIAHAEEDAEAAFVARLIHAFQPSNARGRPFVVSDARFRPRE